MNVKGEEVSSILPRGLCLRLLVLGEVSVGFSNSVCVVKRKWRVVVDKKNSQQQNNSVLIQNLNPNL